MHLISTSARLIKSLGQRTVFRGTWLIILFVYKYIADTVANILKCVALNGDDINSRYDLRLVSLRSYPLTTDLI